ncbi:hypothetical protein LCGC14_2346300 [marine sediment metagenome]|uniref:Uncharacterized protein n=1 Tax=marine sediment metagenome TaxID=412755 RepID=A0A0F9CAG0_9ZZZZ
MDSNKPPSDAAPVAEATEVIAANVMRLLDVDGSPSTDLLNLLAGYGIRCEQDGFGDGRLELKLETMEFKIGLIPDRRKAAHPDDAPRPDKASQGSTVSGGERPEQVEDAPEGDKI